MRWVEGAAGLWKRPPVKGSQWAGGPRTGGAETGSCPHSFLRHLSSPCCRTWCARGSGALEETGWGSTEVPLTSGVPTPGIGDLREERLNPHGAGKRRLPLLLPPSWLAVSLPRLGPQEV